ncbi:MAG: glutamate-cysteine ligase family protein [Cyanobacteriota bacterium]|nr:glutamate-cysteine ligase family protein [Cyanobacteriota bacterium]
MFKLESNVLQKSDILKLYTKGCKNPQDFMAGIEYERLPINLSDYRAASYDGSNGMSHILENFAQINNWNFIVDQHNIIGLAKEHDTITLEPGSQLEISTKPERTIFALKNKIDKINSMLKPVLEKNKITLLNYGVSPLSVCKNIKLIPKRRYYIMAKYLWGILSDVMMRETAGIQCCIDFKSEEDAMRKFKLANKLSPFMTAMFANSPIRGGVDTGYKSFRALSWLNTDNDRCGFAGKISEEFSFEDYIDTVMKTPMIFIQREKQPIVINGNVTFEEFLNHGYDNISANIDDYELHANLCFPEVRLRNFIEIRNHDCVGGDLKYAILAIYKGIFYDNNAMSETEDLLKGLQYRDFSEMRYNVPKCAMQTAVKNYKIADYAKEILKIAEKSLKNAQTGENLFLNSIKEYTMKGLCPADVILKKWNGVWNKDLGKMIKYLTELENNV